MLYVPLVIFINTCKERLLFILGSCLCVCFLETVKPTHPFQEAFDLNWVEVCIDVSSIIIIIIIIIITFPLCPAPFHQDLLKTLGTAQPRRGRTLSGISRSFACGRGRNLQTWELWKVNRCPGIGTWRIIP